MTTATAPTIDPQSFATLQARCALLGVSLLRSTDDAGREVFIVSKWALCRKLDSPAAVEQFLRQVGGPDA